MTAKESKQQECSVGGCTRPITALGMCKNHYYQVKRNGVARDIEVVVGDGIGTRIRSVRKGLGIPQSELSKMLGFSYRAVSVQEGRSRMWRSTVDKYARALGVPAEALISGGTVEACCPHCKGAGTIKVTADSTVEGEE